MIRAHADTNFQHQRNTYRAIPSGHQAHLNSVRLIHLLCRIIPMVRSIPHGNRWATLLCTEPFYNNGTPQTCHPSITHQTTTPRHLMGHPCERVINPRMNMALIILVSLHSTQQCASDTKLGPRQERIVLPGAATNVTCRQQNFARLNTPCFIAPGLARNGKDQSPVVQPRTDLP